MTRMVQVALAGDVGEAEELQGLLGAAGIDSVLEPENEADGLKVMVAENELELAVDAIEAFAGTDDETPVD